MKKKREIKKGGDKRRDKVVERGKEHGQRKSGKKMLKEKPVSPPAEDVVWMLFVKELLTLFE
ncbi:hypothetical protein EBR66_03970 [bacterium]|nr:hypothetical protein [bacterium]